MDGRSAALLELPAISRLLAAETAFAAGEELALALTPSSDAAEVAYRQTLTTEAIALLASPNAPRLGGAHDIRRAALAAERRATLHPADLAAISSTCRAANEARSLTNAVVAPELAAVVSGVSASLLDLAHRIDRAIDADGERVRDDASPALARLRREIIQARRRANERLRALAGSLKDHLQEDFVTERHGRPVLAVKASSRSRVPGVVHDTSGSGQTLFVEPFALVEIDNELRELEAAERDETERILADLSRQVGVAAPDLTAAVDALAILDLSLARAQLSRRWSGCPVRISSSVHLAAARHPLLDEATAVPVDLPLGEIRTLVISGPNAGGKTVAMKTLGLFALMHQCGLRLPAREARLPVFADVLAEIGDEQSILQSLSSFSGHLTSLVRILEHVRRATGPCMVLVDELCSGTDPIEGAALARATLERLRAQAALTVVTTHFDELKEWGSATEGVLNAAVGFDPETLAPTYHLALGRPGPSHALAIAGRLGIPEAVVEKARALIEPGRRRSEDLLAQAAGAESAAREALAAAEAAGTEAEALRADAARRERELREALAAVRAGATAERERVRREAEAALAGYQRELDALRDEIREARRDEERRRQATAAAETRRAPPPVASRAAQAADRAGRDRDRRLDAASKHTRRAAELVVEAISTPIPMRQPLAPGDPVQAPALGIRGTITEISGGIAEVQNGSLRVRVPVDRLEPDGQPRDRRLDARPVRINVGAPQDVPDRLDMHGERVEAARARIRSWVDDAFLAGKTEIICVHGHGTGQLRKAVRAELAKHPLVDSFAPTNGDAATSIRLAVRANP